MGYNITYVAAETTAEALPLYWQDQTLNIPTGEFTAVWDRATRTYINVPVSSPDFTVPGISRKYPTLEEFYAVQPYARVVNNIVQCPYESSAQSNAVSINSYGGTRLLTTRDVEGFSLTLAVPGLYKIDKNVGYVETTVSVGIYYRVYNPAQPLASWNVVYANYVISGKQRAEILKTIKHSTSDTKLPLATYEIVVIRNTEDHTGNLDYVDDVYVKDITEILYSEVAYIHTALLGVKIRATDQLSGQLPTVTAVVKGVKVSVPSNLVAAYTDRYNSEGSFNKTLTDAAYASGWLDGLLGETKVWTDNPVWCLYDLLTNSRYGLANYYKIDPAKRGLMLANFYLMAKYCDEAIQYTDDSGAVPVQKYRPRFALNIVLDQTKPASEWISQIAAIMRASVFYSEGIFWIEIDRDKPVSQLFSMSEITDYTQSCTSYKSIPNSYEVQWVNPLTNYEIDTFKLETKALQVDPSLEEYKKAMQLVGVTNFDQAKALANYAILVGESRSKIVSFKTGTNGLRSALTDVVGVQHDVPRWGYGGSVVSFTEGTSVIKVHPAVEFSPGSSYVIKIDHPGVGVSSYPVVNPGEGLFDEFELSTSPTTPILSNETFWLGVATNDVALFKISSINRDTDELVSITAMSYNATLFPLCDTTSELGVMVQTNYSLLTNPTRSSVAGVMASTKIYQDGLGVWKTGVDVFYDVNPSSFWSGAQLHYAVSGSGLYTSAETNNTGHFVIPALPDGTYQVVVTSVYTEGRQTLSDALSDSTVHPWAIVTVSNFAPADEFLLGVTGLCIGNQANDGSFTGRDCVVTWRKPGVMDMVAYTNAGEETAGAATGTADNWFSHYEVVVSSAGTGNIRRTETVYNESYVYTHEMNMQDGVARAFVVTVYAYDKIGRKSEGVTLECANPAPVAIA